MHGNEPCGANAVQAIRKDLEEGRLHPARGTLFLIHANPEARSQGLRHTSTGEDLNRLWDFAFVESRRKEAWGYEHRRAVELKEVLAELDILLDLHSAFSQTPAFAISNGVKNADAVAKQLGVSYLVQSWYGLADKVIIGYLKNQDLPAISVECGAHGDPEINDKALEISLRYLRETGVLNGSLSFESQDVKSVRVVESFTKPSEEFRFGEPFTGFQRLPPGTLLGSDRVTEIRVNQACYTVLPNDQVAIGEDIIYLAVDA